MIPWPGLMDRLSTIVCTLGPNLTSASWTSCKITHIQGCTCSRYWESVSHGLHVRRGPGCPTIPLDRWCAQGSTNHLHFSLHSSRLRSFLESISTQCNHQTPLEQVSHSHPWLVKTLSQSTHVDDIISGVKSDDDAYLLYKESKSLLKAGGFNLRKFITNSNEPQERINKDEGVLHASCFQDFWSRGDTHQLYTWNQPKFALGESRKSLVFAGMF